MAALVVVVLAGVGGFILLRPGHHSSVTPMANGVVVADGTDQFQVLAPSGWQLRTQADDASGAFRLTAQDPADATDTLELEVDPEGDTGPFVHITDYYEGELRLISKAGAQLTASVRTRYAGQDSYRFEYGSGSGASAKQNMETIFLREHKIFVVTYTAAATRADRHQMLAVLASEQFVK